MRIRQKTMLADFALSSTVKLPGAPYSPVLSHHLRARKSTSHCRTLLQQAAFWFELAGFAGLARPPGRSLSTQTLRTSCRTFNGPAQHSKIARDLFRLPFRGAGRCFANYKLSPGARSSILGLRSTSRAEPGSVFGAWRPPLAKNVPCGPEANSYSRA